MPASAKEKTVATEQISELVSLEQSIARRLKDENKFIDWLYTKEPAQVVGTAMENESCPIACFLYETVGVKSSVDPYCIKYDNLEYTLQQWTKDFIDAVDELNTSRPVTAEECLSYLLPQQLS